MQLYLMQHGVAITKDVDPERPLTQDGREVVMKMAELAARLHIEVAHIRHSDKLRADQTAEVLERALGTKRTQVPGLGPNDDVNPVAREMASLDENIIIVGHLPFLSRLAAFLLCHDESLPVVEFQNAGIVRLDRSDDGRWSLKWSIPPEAAL